MSLKFIGQASRLEIQVGIDVSVLWQNFFFSWKPQILPFRLLTDWMRTTHIMEDNILYSQSADSISTQPTLTTSTNNPHSYPCISA